MKKFLLIFCVLLGCKSDETVTPFGSFSDGIIITHEGVFNQSNSAISFYNADTLINDVYKKSNNTKILGDVLQSAKIYDEKLFLVVNNSNKVEVINKHNFKKLYTLTDRVKQPRYLSFGNEKGYLTNWDDAIKKGYMLIFNPKNGIVEDTVTLPIKPEDIAVVNNKIFVTEAYGSKLLIMDIQEKKIVKTLNIGEGASEMTVDKNQNLWIACEGGFDEAYKPKNNGGIYQIASQTNHIMSSISISKNIEGEIATNAEKNRIFFLVENQVYHFSIDKIETQEVVFSVSEVSHLYSLGVDSQKDRIYVGEKTFTEMGQVFIYDLKGNFIKKMTTGFAPNGFLLQ